MTKRRSKITTAVLAACAVVSASSFAQERGGGVDPFRSRPAANDGASRRAAPRPQQPVVADAAGGLIASVEFIDTPITNVFKMISDTTGWSIITSPGVSGQKAPTINLFVKNIAPQDLLDQVMISANLVADRTGNIVHVMTFEEFARAKGLERRVVQLKHADAAAVATLLVPFIDPQQSKVLPDPAGNKLVLLVPNPLSDSLVKLITSLDVPFAKDEVKIIKLKHLEADRVVPPLEDFLTSGKGAGGRGANNSRGGAGAAVPLAPAAANPPPANPVAPVPGGAPGAAAAAQGGAGGGAEEGRRAGEDWLVQFFVEPKLNLIVLRGLADDVRKTAELIESLDVPADLKVVAYPLHFTNAADAFDTLQQLIQDDLRGSGFGGRGGGSGRTGRSSAFGGGGIGSQDQVSRLRVAPSEQNNQIIVEGSADDHARMSRLIEAIDRPLPPGSGGIRVYKLENATSTEVADVLTSIVEDRARQAVRTGAGGGSGTTTTGASRGTSAGASSFGPRAGSYGASGGGGAGRRAVQASSGGTATGAQGGAAAPTPSSPTASSGDTGGGGGGGGEAGGSGDVIPPRITDAPEINAVVVRASASEHEELEAVIKELDRPRDQVTLEVTLVAVRSTDNFNLGVEMGMGGNHALGLTTFGVGTPDPATGRVSISASPPTGLNFGVIDAGDFTMVINALKSVGDVRISSAPKVLVQDNAPAQIRQVNREPYAVTSQGQSSTITSFGDYAEAGTTLTVTPHISRDQWLRLEYAVQLSSFDQRNAAQLAANLPPPTRQSESTGIVRIPSDSMVVLGGLVSTRDENTNDHIPFLGDIPGLGLLFGKQFIGRENETLFIFIRPTVLRDLKFRDLRYLSEDDIRAAKVSMQEYPTNEFKSLAPPTSAAGGGKKAGRSGRD